MNAWMINIVGRALLAPPAPIQNKKLLLLLAICVWVDGGQKRNSQPANSDPLHEEDELVPHPSLAFT
jgi:hypothetical protein